MSWAKALWEDMDHVSLYHADVPDDLELFACISLDGECDMEAWITREGIEYPATRSYVAWLVGE